MENSTFENELKYFFSVFQRCIFWARERTVQKGKCRLIKKFLQQQMQRHTIWMCNLEKTSNKNLIFLMEMRFNALMCILFLTHFSMIFLESYFFFVVIIGWVAKCESSHMYITYARVHLATSFNQNSYRHLQVYNGTENDIETHREVC